MTIWKFPLSISDRLKLSMPSMAQILTIESQDGIPCMWALVNPTAPLEERHFAVHGTGHEVPDDGRLYIGTAQMLGGKLIWHFFELLDVRGEAP